MASIIFDKVTVDFPVYNYHHRSLKNALVQVATGGKLGSDTEGRTVVRALENLSFTLSAGDRVGILGHNGAGKSTLLRLLCGVYEPTSGHVERDGDIGSLIDISLGVDPEATGRENIYVRGALLGLAREKINTHLEEIVDFSELGEFIDMPLRTYSTGMHLRLAFAVSTIVKPSILLMDEWLSVGDESFKAKAEERLNALIRSTEILVVASHSKELIRNVCNRCIWLEHGRIRMDAGAAEVVGAYFGN